MEIDNGIDLNTCCGTHLPSLGHMQMIKFFRVERVKSAAIRVHFAAGGRLRKILDESFERQTRLTDLFSCTEDEQVPRAKQLLADIREGEREVKLLQERLCFFQAKDIEQCCRDNENVAVVDLGSGYEINFMSMLSKVVLENMGNDSCGILLLLLSSKEPLGDEGSFLLTGDVGLVDGVKKQVAEIFSGRGGGNNGKFQGKGMKIHSGLDKVKKYLAEQKQTS